MTKNISSALLLCFTLLPGWLAAASLEEILALAEEPTGVVIEIVESSASALKELIPDIQQATGQIRKKYPELPIAVVSHGYEQFALTTKNLEKNSQLKNGVKNLIDKDIDLHVCGTHASWFNVEPGEYPDYIDVSATGPAQINDYLNVGYVQLEL